MLNLEVYFIGSSTIIGDSREVLNLNRWFICNYTKYDV